MAFRLETFQFDCRANMPTRYGRDLRCRGCNPGLQAGQGQEREQGDQEQEDQEQEQGEQEQEQGEQSRLRARSTLRAALDTVSYGRGWAPTHLCPDVGSSSE